MVDNKVGITPDFSYNTNTSGTTSMEIDTVLQILNVLYNFDGNAYTNLFGFVGVEKFINKRFNDFSVNQIKSKINEILTSIEVEDIGYERKEIRASVFQLKLNIQYKYLYSTDKTTKVVTLSLVEGNDNNIQLDVYLN